MGGLRLDVTTDDAQGCLQDIHWSFGAIGYFPSYTLGAIMAAQIFHAAQADLGKEARPHAPRPRRPPPPTHTHAPTHNDLPTPTHPPYRRSTRRSGGASLAGCASGCVRR